MAAAATRAGERLERATRREPAPMAMSVAAQRITYNILLMPKGSGHYVKAGQKTMLEVARRETEIDLAFDGRAIRGVIAQVYMPPGCDEHCIGTLFVREV